MFGLELWVIWIIIGLLFMIIEIFTPGFYFMSVGVAAIFTGLIGFFIPNPIVQLGLFAILCFILFVYLRKLALKFFITNNIETNAMALVGKRAKVTQTILRDEKGYVKVSGEEWVAISEEERDFEIGEKVKIVKIDGTKLIIQSIQKEA